MKWFLVYYNEDMDRCTETFEMDTTYYGLSKPTKQLIEKHLKIDIYNNWTISQIKE